MYKRQIPDREDDVVRLATRAFNSAAMGRARLARRVLREVPFAVKVDGTIVEGFIDMLIQTSDGFEIVDWKTDDIASAEVDRRLDQYRTQAGLYALALAEATGRAVSGITYVFLSLGIERDMGNVPALSAAARERLLVIKSP